MLHIYLLHYIRFYKTNNVGNLNAFNNLILTFPLLIIDTIVEIRTVTLLFIRYE